MRLQVLGVKHEDLMPTHSSSPTASSPLPAVTLSSVFLAAQRTYRGVRDQHRRLSAEAEGAAAVATLDQLAREDREHRSAAALRAKAETFSSGRELTARQLAEAVERTDECVVQHEPILQKAKLEFERARGEEVVRVARALEPAHRKGVRQLAEALEAVSEAIVAERAIRARLTDLGLGDAPALLPDTSSELSLGTFDEWSSRISEWRRKYYVLGILG